uniref:Uncharacterized protein n=1 Tax=Oryza punctata TaxID=4537 RepID=A0A0E0LU79_ORYPU
MFTWAKCNNRRLLHVGDIDRTSKFYIYTSCSMWLITEHRLKSVGDKDNGWLLLRIAELICYCTSLCDSITDYRSLPDYEV